MSEGKISGTFTKRRATPTVLQMEAVECGAAALAMVLGYYGRWEPLEKLRVECGISRDGSKASNIVKAARRFGLKARGVMVKADDVFSKGEMPAIAFWDFNHFVVVEGVKGDKVAINDPAFGPRVVTKEEFTKSFSRVLLIFEKTDSFEPGGKPPGLIGNLAKRLQGSGDALSLVVLISLMLVIPGLVMPAALKAFVDSVMVQNMTGWILPLILGLGAAAIINAVLTWLQQGYLLSIQNKLAITSAGALVWHLIKLPIGFYTQRQTGDIAGRVEACGRVANLLAGPLSTNIANSMMIVFYAIVMSVISWQLTASVVALSALNWVAAKMVKRKRTDTSSRLLNRRARLTAASVGGLQAIETLKATGTEHDFFTRWAGEHANVLEAQQSIGVSGFLLDTVPRLLNQLLTAVVLGFGAIMIMEGNLTIGGLVAFQALLTHFTQPIQSLVGFSSQLQEIKGDLVRIDDAMRYESDPVLQSALDAPITEARLHGNIEMRNVSFSYGPLDPVLINDFSLSIPEGGRVALVGGSGSGKSTLARMIVGLYQPISGEILFDQRPMMDIARLVFTDSVAYVDQDVQMFEGTVFDNITMWDDSIPEEDVIAACKDACIHDVIAARPGGYQSAVDEGGANFSGGQRQRLEIARALVRRPKIIVLDEATAALDPITEQLIDQNIKQRGCSTVVIAHRLSTIRDADEIVVLDRGEVVERGNHNSLMASEGRYAQLVSLG